MLKRKTYSVIRYPATREMNIEAGRHLPLSPTWRRSRTLSLLRSREPPGSHRLQVSTVVCAPVLTRGHALGSQVSIGPDEGMKYESWIVCDNLASVRKTELTQSIGSLSFEKVAELDEALRIALALD